VARSTVRRAERRVVELDATPHAVNPDARRYLNRLSDLLFVLARSVAGQGDVPSRRR
jgi:cob(I)alamin adenosyltransferase